MNKPSSEEREDIGTDLNGNETDDPRQPLCRSDCHDDPSLLISSSKTMMNILRCMVGPGCFALPVSFLMAGLWVGLGMIFFIGFCSAYCMLMLVDSAQYLCKKSGRLELDYGHLAKKAFDYSTPGLKKYSKLALYITNAIICIYQLGVCSVQLVFLFTHLKEMFEVYVHTVHPVSTSIFATVVFFAILPISLIRKLKSLAPCVTAGNIFMLTTFVIIFQKIIMPPNRTEHLPSYTNFTSSMLAMGSMLYAFEGQAVILPLENKMKHPEDMIGWNGVLSVSMSIVTCVYAATGFYGYATFGDAVKGSITLNMPQTWLYELVKVLLMIAVFVGYPVQLYVITEMFWPAIQRKSGLVSERKLLILEMTFRILLVFVTYLVAILIPNLEKIIPFVGVTAGSLLGFVFPPFISLISHSEEVTTWENWNKVYFFGQHVFFIILGIFASTVGLYSSILYF